MKTLLTLVTLIALSAVIAAIVVGSRSFEGIVTERPYEKGLSWDKAEDERRSLNWDVSIREKTFAVGRNTLTVLVRDKRGMPLEPASLSVTVSRPSTTSHDKTYKGERLDDGSYRAVVDLPLYGHWDLRINVLKDQNTITYTRSIFAEK